MQDVNPLQIHKQTLPFLNISLYLNGRKPLQSLSIENTTGEEAEAVTVKISSDLPVLAPFEYLIPQIPAGKQVEVPLKNLHVNRTFLNTLSETEKAEITIALIKDEYEQFSETFSVEVHSLEQFGGFHVLPELIASYITPNHPYVYHIKRKAADILSKNGLPPSFDGYQGGGPERVLQVMSALFGAIQSEDIIYSSLAPGYEESGQRLRLLDTIQREKFGNCIDLSLLFAACLEAADLNPILIIVRGHAFIGCWLQDDKFAETVNDDKAAITKRLSKGIREIAAVEATSVCRGGHISFGEALNRGEAQLVEREDFLCSIDIRRARTLHIRPLPLIITRTGIEIDAQQIQTKPADGIEKEFEIGTIYEDELLQGGQPKTKQKIWERKLLDLSLRNNLINLRMTRNMLQLIDIDISVLEDTLSDGRSFYIVPSPSAEVQRKYNIFTQPLHASSPLYQIANDEFRHHRLLTHYHPQDLDHILSYIHKNAKQAVEENGSSTLYLGVGLLKWYDRKTPDQARFAPILLIPAELNRRSVNSKFTLKSREEETMINITLIEFLRQEYELNLDALEELPTDDKGVDVAKVMGILRRAIMQLKGWDVEEQLVLGNFSFNKLILWKDIVDHQAELLQSTMVRSLVEGKLTTVEEVILPENMDQVASASTALPIPTDVSQMEAVLAAQQGQSFILHGPPGTGKSQTITNIIADSLYHGKRVLFVAAKKAALDVVQRRLDQIGLGPYTLELHSNKSKKSHVLEQLAYALETGRLSNERDFEQEASRLDQAKEAISSYVQILHRKQPIGWNLYDSISALGTYQERRFPTKYIAEEILANTDENKWQQWNDWLQPYIASAGSITHPAENPLRSLHLPQYTPAVQEAIAAQTSKLLRMLPEVTLASQATASALSFPFSIQSRAEWQQFVQIVTALDKLPSISVQLLQYISDREHALHYSEWLPVFKEYKNASDQILCVFERSVLTTDINTLTLQWRKAQQSWFLPKWLQTRKIKKQLSLYKKSPVITEQDVEDLFADHKRLQEAERLLQQPRFQQVQEALGSLYRQEQTDIDEVERITRAVQQLQALTTFWEPGALTKWMQQWQQQHIQYTDDLLQPQAEVLNQFRTVASELQQSLAAYETLTGVEFKQTAEWTEEMTQQLMAISRELPLLKNWMNYLHFRSEGERLQLTWLLDAYEDGTVNLAELPDYFQYTVHASLAHHIISKHEALSLFDARLFESKVEQYKSIAKMFQQLTIQELQVRLSQQLPNTLTEALQSSELGILQRAIKSRGRGVSIRKLFDQIPALLPRLSPCMLMSPISVAQYFDASTEHFDVLIFDEASQLPTCEAVSALARAKQVIIVGDPKQMPPTSFFSTTKLDEENMEIEDLESILDDCLSLSVPSKYLLRHYRSKHESLIAFSNVNYYDSKLLTFPSSDDMNRKVKYHHVEGSYDKGKSRTNRFEADAIVQFVQRHYMDPKSRALSIGIVTFSQTQQTLIEDRLQQVFMADPLLEEYAISSEEPLFIKNLENVQGDERDIILFSIGYGPDEDGKVSMNFGPLNREGGWRRLNVAVTRARYEMHIFATLKADDIDLRRTSSEGVAGLKAFLQFAEKGQLNLRPEQLAHLNKQRELSANVRKKLSERGLQVERNIGTSGFKLDIGIVHPEHPQQYIMGIMIDGHHYFNARTMNDRELVMPTVLQSLGWHIYRLWTLDWFENPDKITDHIVEEVERLQRQPKAIEESPAAADPKPAVFEPVKALVKEVIPVQKETKAVPYTAAFLPVAANATSETIFDFKNRNMVRKQLQALIDTEGPISKNLLYKKLLQQWNTSRAGARLDRHLEGILQEMKLHVVTHHQPFYCSQQEPIAVYRANDVEKRNIEDIAPEEILVAAEEVLRDHLSIEEDELLRYLARTFGFMKVGRQIHSLLSYALQRAVDQGKFIREDNRIKAV